MVPLQSPLAEHELALVEDQFKDIDSPSSIDEDEDENDVIDGFAGEGGFGVSVEPPPLPPPQETNTIESRREKILCIFLRIFKDKKNYICIVNNLKAKKYKVICCKKFTIRNLQHGRLFSIQKRHNIRHLYT